ncbi:MAG TPA: hypothetical protein GX692_04460 [Acholeplasmataceae bacterium]|nr:hypothetical protein [Acholeplasmataceae bacterium]
MFKRKHQAAARDFQKEDLPSDRKEVFFDLLKYRFDLIMKNGLLLFLFLLPAFLLAFGHHFIMENIHHRFISSEITETEYLSLITAYRNTKNVVLIFCLLIFSIGLSGIIRITKMMVWYDYIFYSSDFVTGIKQNFKHLAVLSILYGLVNYLNGFLMGIKIEGRNSNLINPLLKALPLGFTLILFIPISLLVISEISVYDNNFLKRLRNGTEIYFNTFIKTAGMTFILLSPLAFVLLINNVFVQIAIMIALSIFYLPIIIIIWLLYSYSVFDLYINVKLYPELVDKGINRKKE